MASAALTPLIRSTVPFDLRKEDDFNYIIKLLTDQCLPSNVPILAGIAPTQPEEGDVYLWQGILAQHSLIPVDHHKWRFYGRTLAPKTGDSRIEKIFMRGAVVDQNGQRGYLKDIKKHVYRIYGENDSADPSLPQKQRRCLVHYLNTPTAQMANDMQRLPSKSPTKQKRKVIGSLKVTSELAAHQVGTTKRVLNGQNKTPPQAVFAPCALPTPTATAAAAVYERPNSSDSYNEPGRWTSRNIRRRKNNFSNQVSSTSTPPSGVSNSAYADDEAGAVDLSEIVLDAVLEAVEPLQAALHVVSAKLDVAVRRLGKMEAAFTQIRKAVLAPVVAGEIAVPNGEVLENCADSPEVVSRLVVTNDGVAEPEFQRDGAANNFPNGEQAENLTASVEPTHTQNDSVNKTSAEQKSKKKMKVSATLNDSQLSVSCLEIPKMRGDKPKSRFTGVAGPNGEGARIFAINK